MDAVLLSIQVVLVILLIVIPLFSGYDKWQSWTPRRRIIAAILGVGIGVVAFSQYQRIVFLRKTGLAYVAGNAEVHTARYQRHVSVHPLEYVISVAVGSLVLAFAFQAGQRRRWGEVAGYVALFTVILLVGLAVKLHWWRA